MTLINVNYGHGLHRRRGRARQLRHVRLQHLQLPPASIQPDLQQAIADPVSQVVWPGRRQVYTSSWTFASTADPVSAVLMHSNVMNEFVLDAGTKSGTDWVVTFPTKRYYVNVGTGNAPKLFQRNFNTTEGSCDDVSLAHLRPRRTHDQHADRLLAAAAHADQVDLLGSERRDVQQQQRARRSVNNARTSRPAFQNGWLNLGLPDGHHGRLGRRCTS